MRYNQENIQMFFTSAQIDLWVEADHISTDHRDQISVAFSFCYNIFTRGEKKQRKKTLWCLTPAEWLAYQMASHLSEFRSASSDINLNKTIKSQEWSVLSPPSEGVEFSSNAVMANSNVFGCEWLSQSSPQWTRLYIWTDLNQRRLFFSAPCSLVSVHPTSVAHRHIISISHNCVKTLSQNFTFSPNTVHIQSSICSTLQNKHGLLQLCYKHSYYIQYN